MKISSILPGSSFRLWLSIQLWMSLRPVCQTGERRERVGCHQHNSGMTYHEQRVDIFSWGVMLQARDRGTGRRGTGAEER